MGAGGLMLTGGECGGSGLETFELLECEGDGVAGGGIARDESADNVFVN